MVNNICKLHTTRSNRRFPVGNSSAYHRRPGRKLPYLYDVIRPYARKHMFSVRKDGVSIPCNNIFED